ncbi:MAG: prepilin-type N-terminal cleavage/methylation domain-containing protein [Nitrospira sp.]|nr:prepilin-type N-terminal cleavage/methylation domain-containing protein [Candidatus Manganitrophaceae bacterium]HIL34583.1 prepilin-type N-terminal cleavage/methylation domain-containing protein [Candidatus Manganitrophaceae bacterium]
MVYKNKALVRNSGQNPAGLFNRMGFTLIEMMVALTMVGVVLGGVYRVFINFNDHAIVTEDVSSMQQNVRVSIEQITRELRSAGYRFGSPVTGILGSVSQKSIIMDENNQTDEVTIQGDFDDNGTLEKVTYAISCTENPCLHPWLMRKYDDGMGLNTPQFEPFSENITNITFMFYGKHPTDGTNSTKVEVNTSGSTGPSSVRRVYVELTGRTDSPDPKRKNHPDGEYRVRKARSDVVLRNFNASNGDTDPPLCPTTTSAAGIVGMCGQLKVDWTNPSITNDIAGLRIYYSTDVIDKIPPTPPASGGNSDYGSMDVLCSPTCPVTAILTGLNSDATYNIIVESFDSFGNVSRCAPPASTLPEVKLSFAATPDAGVAPMAPAGLNSPLIEMSVTQVGLHWSPVTLSVSGASQLNLQGYRVYRGSDENFTPVDWISGTQAGGNQIAGETTTTFTSFLDTTVVACEVYFYKVKAVNTCGEASAASVALKVTPPDNNRAPVTPVISQLVAGDDTSTLILDWKVPKPVDLALASTPVLLKVYYKLKTSGTWLTHSAIDLTVMTLPATGKVIFNGLASNTVYEVMLKTFDAAGDCGDFTDSLVSSISTAACAPKIQWTTLTGMIRGGHKIYPGLTPTGTQIDYLSGRTVVGSDPNATSDPDFVPNSRYITWVVDPLDCTPDSSNFDRQGFDYSNPPEYTIPSIGAKVDFFINTTGDQSNIPADIAYGKGVSSVPAPRSGDGYYHFPFYPLTTVDLDTGLLCSGEYNFKIRAVDGEQYTAENTISLTIMTGGVQVNSAFVIKTRISTGDDYHHIVELEVINTHPDKDLEMTQMQLSWNNFEAYIQKVEQVLNPLEVLDVLYEDTIVPIDIASGSLLTFNNGPLVAKNGGKAVFRLTFTTANGAIDATVDMRGKKFTSDITSKSFFVTKDVLDASFVCQSPVPNMTISEGPRIVTNSTFLDQPSVSTAPSILVLTDKSVAAGKVVGFSTLVRDLTGNPAYSVSSAKIHYAIRPFTETPLPLPPLRPSVPGGTSSYANSAILSLGMSADGTGSWTGTIPFLLSAGRVWYYLEIFDTDGNYDILPEVGAYTYAQCDATPPTLLFQPPTLLAGAIPNPESAQTNSVTVFANSSTNGIQKVTFKVTGRLGIPPTTMTIQVTDIYTGSYNILANPDLVDLSHTLSVTATDICGNITTITRDYS